MNKKYLKKILQEYAEYEEALADAQVSTSGPRPVSAPFTFPRFYNWLFELEQP
jgi:hypothetical protein